MKLIMFLYFSEFFDKIGSIFTICGIISIIVIGIISIFVFIGAITDEIDLNDNKLKMTFKKLKRVLIFSLIILAIGIIVPTERTSYLMGGAYALQGMNNKTELGKEIESSVLFRIRGEK